jgi:hypothetical protein
MTEINIFKEIMQYLGRSYTSMSTYVLHLLPVDLLVIYPSYQALQLSLLYDQAWPVVNISNKIKVIEGQIIRTTND